MKTSLPTFTKTVTDHTKAGQLIRQARKAAKLSLRSLAKLLDISAPFLSDMELGRRGWSQERFSHAMMLIRGNKS
jgi:transcriptional regulator with XRE-family HTH domain